MISQKELIKQVQEKGNFRSNRLVKLLSFIARFIKLKHDYTGKPSGEFCYLTICNKESFFMVRTSVYTFLKRTDLLPLKVIIISDGSWELKYGEECFSDFKVPFVFENWDASAEYHLKKGNKDLYTWANKQIWGKKFAAILRHAEKSLVLFSDPDILWYSSPILSIDFAKENLLKVSTDNSHNYDENLISKLGAQYLYSAPPVNCGVVLLRGDMFQLSGKIELAINEEAQNPGQFAEQTLFAIMVHEFGEFWSKDEITAEIDDIFSPIVKVSNYPKALKARHYLWKLKWLYWRDFITTKF